MEPPLVKGTCTNAYEIWLSWRSVNNVYIDSLVMISIERSKKTQKNALDVQDELK